jgi:hypothetical protein
VEIGNGCEKAKRNGEDLSINSNENMAKSAKNIPHRCYPIYETH